MKDYATLYQTISSFINPKPELKKLIIFFNNTITKVMYIVYPTLLLSLYLSKRPIREWVIILIVPGISFVLLSLFRKKINAPRPYEEWPIEPLIQRKGSGESFPSRHVFSATIISVCVVRYSLWGGVVCLVLSLLLAVCRVLVGVHYPKDVLVGMLIGLISGSLLFVVG